MRSGSEELLAIARKLEGQLTATIHGTPEDLANAAELIAILERKAGRAADQRLPDRRGGLPVHAPRRPLPRDHR